MSKGDSKLDPITAPRIKIALRVRPEHKGERCDKRHRLVIKPIDEKMLVFDPAESHEPTRGGCLDNYNKPKDKKFAFDIIFDQYATQREVYEQTAQGLIAPVMSGYNATVFAYGATGSGKTHTMIGNQCAGPGVMVLAMRDLFEAVNMTTTDSDGIPVTFKVEMSYLEIYNETIRDLLSTSEASLGVRDVNGECYVQGLSKHSPESSEEVFRLLEVGNSRRSMSPTDQNSESSRSHAVLQIWVTQTKLDACRKQIRTGKLSLVDLAGSERAAVTTNRAQRLVEGANINRSLLALANCINALASSSSSMSKKGKYIPYRDSKLTRLLKDSLGGNCITVMIANISPSSLTFEDTHNTLKYADRAKQIKCSTKQNVSDVKSHVSEYKKTIAQLQKEVETLRTKLARQEAMNESGAGNAFTFSRSSPSLPTIRELYSQLCSEIEKKGKALIVGMQSLLHTRHEQAHYTLDYCRKAIAVDVLKYKKQEISNCPPSHPLNTPSSVNSPIPAGKVRGKELARNAAYKLVVEGGVEWEVRRKEVETLEMALSAMQEKIKDIGTQEHDSLLRNQISHYQHQQERFTQLIAFETKQLEFESHAILSSSYVDLMNWELERAYLALDPKKSFGTSQMGGIRSFVEKLKRINVNSLLAIGASEEGKEKSGKESADENSIGKSRLHEIEDEIEIKKENENENEIKKEEEKENENVNMDKENEEKKEVPISMKSENKTFHFTFPSPARIKTTAPIPPPASLRSPHRSVSSMEFATPTRATPTRSRDSKPAPSTPRSDVLDRLVSSVYSASRKNHTEGSTGTPLSGKRKRKFNGEDNTTPPKAAKTSELSTPSPSRASSFSHSRGEAGRVQSRQHEVIASPATFTVTRLGEKKTPSGVKKKTPRKIFQFGEGDGVKQGEKENVFVALFPGKKGEGEGTENHRKERKGEEGRAANTPTSDLRQRISDNLNVSNSLPRRVASTDSASAPSSSSSSSFSFSFSFPSSASASTSSSPASAAKPPQKRTSLSSNFRRTSHASPSVSSKPSNPQEKTSSRRVSTSSSSSRRPSSKVGVPSDVPRKSLDTRSSRRASVANPPPSSSSSSSSSRRTSLLPEKKNINIPGKRLSMSSSANKSERRTSLAAPDPPPALSRRYSIATTDSSSNSRLVAPRAYYKRSTS